jgi:excisionase family DNA binding protein
MSSNLNIAETAKYLGVPARTLDRWRISGQGPVFIKLGPRQVRYRKVDLDRWMDERAFRSVADASANHTRPSEQ